MKHHWKIFHFCSKPMSYWLHNHPLQVQTINTMKQIINSNYNQKVIGFTDFKNLCGLITSTFILFVKFDDIKFNILVS